MRDRASVDACERGGELRGRGRARGPGPGQAKVAGNGWLGRAQQEAVAKSGSSIAAAGAAWRAALPTVTMPGRPQGGGDAGDAGGSGAPAWGSPVECTGPPQVILSGGAPPVHLSSVRGGERHRLPYHPYTPWVAGRTALPPPPPSTRTRAGVSIRGNPQSVPA